jgi:hypothetical protein
MRYICNQRGTERGFRYFSFILQLIGFRTFFFMFHLKTNSVYENVLLSYVLIKIACLKKPTTSTKMALRMKRHRYSFSHSYTHSFIYFPSHQNTSTIVIHSLSLLVFKQINCKNYVSTFSCLCMLNNLD